MQKKYELLPIKDGENLHRIRALVDIPDTNVKAGDLGGFVASEANLSQTGSCWIYDNARVRDKAKVSMSAQVRDDSEVKDNAVIGELAVIRGKACVSGFAVVCGRAWVRDYSIVTDYATVCDSAQLYNMTVVSGKGHVGGCAELWDSCKVNDFARVTDHSSITGTVTVGGTAKLHGFTKIVGRSVTITESDQVFVTPRAYSSGRYTTAFRGADKTIQVTTGCFVGNLEQFKIAIADTHPESTGYRQQYELFVRLIETYFDTLDKMESPKWKA